MCQSDMLASSWSGNRMITEYLIVAWDQRVVRSDGVYCVALLLNCIGSSLLRMINFWPVGNHGVVVYRVMAKHGYEWPWRYCMPDCGVTLVLLYAWTWCDHGLRVWVRDQAVIVVWSYCVFFTKACLWPWDMIKPLLIQQLWSRIGVI